AGVRIAECREQRPCPVQAQLVLAAFEAVQRLEPSLQRDGHIAPDPVGARPGVGSGLLKTCGEAPPSGANPRVDCQKNSSRFPTSSRICLRCTIRSMKPFSSTNSARWKPGGRSSPIV